MWKDGWREAKKLTNGVKNTRVAVPLVSPFFIDSAAGLTVEKVYIWLEDYRGADKYLARPGKKQPTTTEDFEFHISCLLS